MSSRTEQRATIRRSKVKALRRHRRGRGRGRRDGRRRRDSVQHQKNGVFKE